MILSNTFVTRKNLILCFRLLNSEIGNDQNLGEYFESMAYECFRLLNSEIGNDQQGIIRNFFFYEFSSP